jgi:hypothetical protein
LGTKATGNFRTLPGSAMGAFKAFKIFVPNEVLEKLQTLRISPIAEETYESTRPDRSSE